MKIEMRFYTRINEGGILETACYLVCLVSRKKWFSSKVVKIATVGLSRKNPKDVTDSHIGNRVALNRAMKFNCFTINERKQMLSHYHDNIQKHDTKPEVDKPFTVKTMIDDLEKRGYICEYYLPEQKPVETDKTLFTHSTEKIDAKKAEKVDEKPITPSQVERIMLLLNIPQGDIDRYKNNGIIL